MAKFVAIIKEEEGCDYTIGCGVRVIDIEASDKEEAFKKMLKNTLFIDVARNNSEPSSLENLKSVRLIEIAEEDRKLYKDWIASMTEQFDSIQKEAEEKAERDKYEKLKKRFEK